LHLLPEKPFTFATLQAWP